MVDGKAAVDTFRAQEIAELNAFTCPRVRSGSQVHDEDLNGSSAGVWPNAAHTNHDCIASASRSFLGDTMVVRAVRDLVEGEEVSTTYVPAEDTFENRQSELRRDYGFDCTCRLCTADISVGESVHA